MKLGDPGLAKSLPSASTGLTATGAMMGSPHYMSPEQARGESDVDFRSDIYSLGGTPYHMLSGRTPYEADNVMALLLKQVSEVAPAIFKAWPECPTRVGTLVGRMLSKKREQRPGSYGDLIRELEALRGRDQRSDGTRTRRHSERRRAPGGAWWVVGYGGKDPSAVRPPQEPSSR